jgi:undecaprenyl-diphosphatase
MNILQAIVLGIVQGLTEFLPISSSGHLILIPHLLQWPDQGLAFDAFLHLGTLTAVLFFFRYDLISIIKNSLEILARGSWKEFYRDLGMKILIGSVPIGIAGKLFDDYIETRLRSVTLVVATLIGFAILLWLADRYSEQIKKQINRVEAVAWKEVVVIGLAQTLALIPGTSRSGVTITAGLFSKLNREVAIRFSFLLSIPITAGAGVTKLFQLFHKGIPSGEGSVLAVGFLASMISGILAIKILLRLVQSNTFDLFVFYRIGLGIFLLILFVF